MSDDYLKILENLSATPGASPELLIRLIDAQEAHVAREAEIAFNKALARLQPKLPTIQKMGQGTIDGKNYSHGRYEDIDAAIRPLLADEGFSVFFDSATTDDGIRITGTLAHKGGSSRQASFVAPADQGNGKNDVQAVGSTVSYGKRYILCMLLNIVTKGEDTDAEPQIDQDEIDEIDACLKGSHHKPKFLALMHVEAIEDIRKKDMGKARNALKQMGAAK